jgi:hypothetical protein
LIAVARSIRSINFRPFNVEISSKGINKKAPHFCEALKNKEATTYSPGGLIQYHQRGGA